MKEYHKLTAEDAAYLRSIVSPARVLAGEEIEYDYHHDEMPDFGTYPPEIVIQAVSTEEVSAVMRYAWEKNIPVTPRGAGTGLAGGCVPIYGGIVLSLEKMNRILEWDPDNMTVVVEPGVLVM